MQVTMFKGLLPLNVPDSWIEEDPTAVRFATTRRDGRPAQAIDFRPNGGIAAAFWIESQGAAVHQHWERLADAEADELQWGVSNAHARHVESRQTVKLFGQSAEVLDLESITHTPHHTK